MKRREALIRDIRDVLVDCDRMGTGTANVAIEVANVLHAKGWFALDITPVKTAPKRLTVDDVEKLADGLRVLLLQFHSEVDAVRTASDPRNFSDPRDTGGR